jgi:Zn finger protein HypA/HybF involved in hydrogenase expression
MRSECKTCGKPFTPTNHMQRYCPECRAIRAQLVVIPRCYEDEACKTCGRMYTPTHHAQLHCPECQAVRKQFAAIPRRYEDKVCKTCDKLFAPPHPAHHRCPKCRAYWQSRDRGNALARSNSRIVAALKIYPIKTWSYEVLQRLEPGCSELELRTAEQQHIERLKTWMPEYGLNIFPAVVTMASPEQRAQLSIDCRRLRQEAHIRAVEATEKFWSRYSTEERVAAEQQFLAESKRMQAERRAARNRENYKFNNDRTLRRALVAPEISR